MQSALIGATGFVGQNLRRDQDFTELYDSRTIVKSAGKSFDLVVCAAAPGSMVAANRAPERDAATIDQIITHLSNLTAERVILISTIATLKNFGHGQDEGTEAFETETAYGRNRRRLEAFCEAHFDDHLVLRLPALFGHGLRKNMLFDLMNPVPSMLTDDRRDQISGALTGDVWGALDAMYHRDGDTSMWHLDRTTLDASPMRARIGAEIEASGFEALRFTNPASTFQFFDLSLLWDIAGRATAAGVKTLHLPPEPLLADRIVTALRGTPMKASQAKVHSEDMRTRHAGLFGREDGYIAGADDVLARLRQFVLGGVES
jgi:hypothetical protein